MAQNTATFIVGATAAATAAGPLAEVFDEMGLVMALLGALGGSLRFIVSTRTSRRVRGVLSATAELVSSMFIGAGLAFGLGGLPVDLILAAVNLDVAPDDPGTKFLAAVAFLIGLAQERFLTYTGFYKQPEPVRADGDDK